MMEEKIYYYAYKPTDEDIESTLNFFINKYDWRGLIVQEEGLRIVLKAIIHNLIWYKRYQDDIQSKANKKLSQKEIHRIYNDFAERIRQEIRGVRNYIDVKVDIDMPNVSPSILKELEDILKYSNYSERNITKILSPLKEFAGVGALKGNKTYDIRKGIKELCSFLKKRQETLNK